MSTRLFSARPAGVTAIASLFAFGVLATGLALATLAAPGGVLDTIWRVNPRGHEAFLRMGAWAYPLLGAVCLACTATTFGLMARKKWGYRAAVFMLLMNLAGNLANAITGNEPRAIIGVPIVALILWYLSTPGIRRYFFRRSSAAKVVPEPPR
jgi:hypothetical protein